MSTQRTQGENANSEVGLGEIAGKITNEADIKALKNIHATELPISIQMRVNIHNH